MTWLPAHRRAAMAAEADRLASVVPAAATRGGFGWLDAACRLEPERGVALWITCRMTHVAALASQWGRDDLAASLDHGVAALGGPLWDDEHGGWHASLPTPSSTTDPWDKANYAHAFVILASSSASIAGHPDAPTVLNRALEVHDARFWDEDAGMPIEAFTADFAEQEPYRGVNSAMHTVEAYLAAADATGDELWLRRALRIIETVVHRIASEHSWALPEHFTTDWKPLLDFNKERPADPFRPYGVTIGHLFEWARLTLTAGAAAEQHGIGLPSWLLADATAMYRAAVQWGWAADGADGFVYTTDFGGAPVVRERMHWVVAEAIGAAAALATVTGERAFAEDHERWWRYAERHLIDLEGGSWWHELGPDNRPSGTVWPGKADLYHAVQASLVARLPLAPGFAGAIALGELDA